MDRSWTNSRQDGDVPQTHDTKSQQQDHHRCPHCSKSYRRATWLENHIATKHSTRMTQEQSELLARMSNSYRTSMSNATVLPQSFQELQQATLTRDLSNVLALLKQLFPLMQCLLPILEQLNGASSGAPAMRQSNLRDSKRCASSPDLRGESETKRRELSASLFKSRASGRQNGSEVYPDKTVSHLPSSAHSGDPHGVQHTDSVATLSKGCHIKLGRPAYSRGIPRHSSPGQMSSSVELLSHSSTPYYQGPNGSLPSQRRQSRLPQTPWLHIQSKKTAQVPHERPVWYQTPSFPIELAPRQCEPSSMWLNSAEPLLDTTHPNPDVQSQLLMETPYQELDQHQSALQGLQQDLSSPHQQAFHQSFGDCLDDIFPDWKLSATPNPGSSDSTTSAAQLMRNNDERDDNDHLSHSSF